jgi:hypothetical protein
MVAESDSIVNTETVISYRDVSKLGSQSLRDVGAVTSMNVHGSLKLSRASSRRK